MAKYSVLMQRTAATANSVGVINNSATVRRIKLYDINIGSEAAVADNVFLWQFARITTAGTSTAYTPLPLDPADAAALSTAGFNNTSTEPTYTAGGILMSIPLNQRATFRWVASPGSELMAPATASNGIGVKTPTSTAVAVTANLLFDEQ